MILANALARLSPDHRQVIVLRNFEERPFSEIACQLGRSSSAVRSLWVRALRNLVEIMRTDDASSIG